MNEQKIEILTQDSLEIFRIFFLNLNQLIK